MSTQQPINNPFDHLMRMIKGENMNKQTAHPPVTAASTSHPPMASSLSHTISSSSLRHQGPVKGDGKRAEVGRATWTFLHTLAAQLPDQPSRQQQKDVKALVELLTRVYPCGECADHWRELVKRSPPDVGSGEEFRQWLCRAHNKVNASLGKPEFNCSFLGTRWSPLNCKSDQEDEEEDKGIRGCELTGNKK
jgi:FAD-linked sulfhydryl oxidase